MPDHPFVKYAEFYDAINKDKPYKKEIEFVYKWAYGPKSILDIGCGTASYWKYFPVTPRGVDKSPSMIAQSQYKKYILCQDITKLSWFKGKEFDCCTALFDVINYMPTHSWWKKLPLKKGGYFIFDIWDKDKADKDGFHKTTKLDRIITPKRIKNKVELDILVNLEQDTVHELHTMYLYSDKDIIKYCGKDFEIVDKKETESWQCWFKLKRL